jgi:NAD(P)-dependent dehydrogenase (short-subunit alcohol dehydrogenase family)
VRSTGRRPKRPSTKRLHDFHQQPGTRRRRRRRIVRDRAATARALAGVGYRVALLARRVDRIAALAAQLGNGALAVEADVTDRDALLTAAERCSETRRRRRLGEQRRRHAARADLGRTAGGLPAHGGGQPARRDHRRRVLPRPAQGRRRRHRQHLLRCRPYRARRQRLYAATKWGLNGWSESLRRELLPDVRVTVIEPGAVATELPIHITHAETKQGTEQLYSQVEVSADDIAEVIAFAVGRPRRLVIHEILLRPAGQEL